MLAPEPTRYRQRPPEVDALEVTYDTVDGALTWLRSWGRDGYRATSSSLRVVEAVDGAVGFDVPFGHHLVRDVATGRWAPVPPDQLDREYVSVRAAERDLARDVDRANRGGRRRGGL